MTVEYPHSRARALRICLFVSSMLAMACNLPAQVIPRPSDCGVRLMAAAQLAPTASTGDISTVLSALVGCYPETYYATAAIMRRLASSSDSQALRRVYSAGRHRDTATVHASLEVAGSANASSMARIYAFGALLSALEPSALPRFSQLTAVHPGGRCDVHRVLDASSDSLALAAGLESSIRDAAGAAMSASYLPSGVRSAAYCTLSAWRLRHGYPDAGFQQDPLAEISIAALCESQYEIRNTSAYPATIVLDAPGIRSPRELDVPGREANATAGRVLLTIKDAQQVRLHFDGVAFATAQAATSSCGSP
jgi:hypothetical protein